MKIKITGFKVGQSWPTTDCTLIVLIGAGRFAIHDESVDMMGEAIYEALQKDSDFISIRRVEP